MSFDQPKALEALNTFCRTRGTEAPVFAVITHQRILEIETGKRGVPTTAWLDTNSVLPVSRWARFSRAMRNALDAGVGWRLRHRRLLPQRHRVRAADAELLDVGVKGTRLYRLELPFRIRSDRVRGYGRHDYFIHMGDASHPEREFIEWVDPEVGARRDAESCQARAFGITLAEWLSVRDEG